MPRDAISSFAKSQVRNLGALVREGHGEKKLARETLHNVEGLVDDGVELRHQRDTSLILMGLTDDDTKRFHDARIPYSGATGGSGNDAYVATFLPELGQATKAMGWDHFSVTTAGNQWTVRKT
jgi:hypothetical protein